jgi:hypothetical protein
MRDFKIKMIIIKTSISLEIASPLINNNLMIKENREEVNLELKIECLGLHREQLVVMKLKLIFRN